ncbi:hypothetical protein BJF90_04450 [Pseudonocardia sp. CNS-004]|nr:hypothetical protein BJF90_04450 [Pseudonocardia sp. CNS-004]
MGRGGRSVLLTLQNGLIISAFGAYLVVITADTGWPAGVVALGYAIVQLGNGFLSPLTGWCCDRVGVRAVSARERSSRRPASSSPRPSPTHRTSSGPSS